MHARVYLFYLVVAVPLNGVLCSADRKNWALLIAGSATYENYRHQADVCHAYQILHKAGIPDEQIVVMMVDDIANNSANPVKGNIINHPHGQNLYPGVLKDYTGKDVNAKTFLAVLQGQKDAVRQLSGHNGKVIDSGPNDYIFVYFADHGAPGILGMPEPPALKARDLITALQSMHDKKKFAKLTFYVEACESGSIFENLLPKDINVYVTTAANPHESSYACYFDPVRYTYLGDFYSVNWMEDTDKSDLHTETLHTQYERVKNHTTHSHVQHYGDLSIDQMLLEKFFGENKQQNSGVTADSPIPTDLVPSEDVPIQILKKKIHSAPPNSALRADLARELELLQRKMLQTYDFFWEVARNTYSDLSEKGVYDIAMRSHESIQDWTCYETAVDILLEICPGMDITNNDFALRKLYVLVNLCNNKSTGQVIAALHKASVINPLCHA